ncbi:MAG: hypothetical protein J6O54_03740 [Prevotella sp.]|nr:hypothetical protein [Prevotella sp.]
MEENKDIHPNRNIYFPDREITYDDLKFVCYMIERTARRIKQPNIYVVDHLGKNELLRNLSLADVLHSENPDDVSDRWISEYQLKNGATDVLDVDKSLTPVPPTPIQMGKVYARLISSTLNSQESAADGIFRVYHSPICQQLDNYNCSAYYEPSYFITRAYIQGNFN